jgi:senataxin
MPKSIPSAEVERIRARLAHYRDHPTDTKGVPESDLESFYNYLVKTENSQNASIHWFCSKAEDPLVTEAATFLLRLHAYNGGRVIEWRKQLQTCLGCCCDCVRGLQENRISSRDTCVVFILLYYYQVVHSAWWAIGTSAHSPTVS